jgi:dTMP kinase
MARFEHLERVILPALESGSVVISDRFEMSSYAYQVHALGDKKLENMFFDLHKHVAELLRPFECTYVFCDVHPEVGLARVDSRGEKKNIFDEKTLDFHHKVREGMHHACGCMDTHFTYHVLDASQSEEDMLKSALLLLETR